MTWFQPKQQISALSVNEPVTKSQLTCSNCGWLCCARIAFGKNAALALISTLHTCLGWTVFSCPFSVEFGMLCIELHQQLRSADVNIAASHQGKLGKTAGGQGPSPHSSHPDRSQVVAEASFIYEKQRSPEHSKRISIETGSVAMWLLFCLFLGLYQMVSAELGSYAICGLVWQGQCAQL